MTTNQQEPAPPITSRPMAPRPAWVMNGQMPPALQQLSQRGVGLASTKLAPRIIAELAGETKTGKTYTALSAPDPIYYVTFDPRNIEGVVEEFVRKGKWVLPYPVTFDLGKEHDFYKPIYIELCNFIRQINESAPERGTLIIDNGKNLELLIRLFLYGKYKQIATVKFEDRNAEIEAFFQLTTNNSLNVIWVHNMSDQWESYVGADGKEQRRPTGRRIIDRFERVDQRVQMNMITERPHKVNDKGVETDEFGDFHIYMSNNRLNSSLAGQRWTIPHGWDGFIPWLMAQTLGGTPEMYV